MYLIHLFFIYEENVMIRHCASVGTSVTPDVAEEQQILRSPKKNGFMRELIDWMRKTYQTHTQIHFL